MKCKYVFIFLMALLASQSGFAQLKGGHQVGYRFLGSDGFSPYGSEPSYGFTFSADDAFDAMHPGAEISYYYGVTDWFSVGLPFKIGKLNFTNNDSLRTDFNTTDELFYAFDLRARAAARFFDNPILTPYISTGLGTMWMEGREEWDLQLPVELGVDLRLAENFFLSLSTEYRVSFDEMEDGDAYTFTDNMQHALGFKFNFGGESKPKETPPPPPAPEPSDRDEDGVMDEMDSCPDVAGLAKFDGCPDTDEDGVADADDSCPEVAGILAFNGCPDTDEDGIQDKDDKCPEMAGLPAFDGCPDTDGDGLSDKEDDCPNEIGTKENNGCPVKVEDRDADGVEDAKDECPDTPGKASLNGCPDADGDGITDKADQCPSLPGTKAFNGCPDSDGDGVPDKDDKCPNKKGVVANSGCPEIQQEDKATLEFAKEAIEFETGSAVIRTSSYDILNKIANIMKKYPEYNMSISGYTDSVGNSDSNLALSQKRAKACFDYLVSKGVPASRMSHRGYGEADPIADNGTKEGRQRNRRVEFDIFLR